MLYAICYIIYNRKSTIDNIEYRVYITRTHAHTHTYHDNAITQQHNTQHVASSKQQVANSTEQ